jgi:hypothetical protein
LANSWVRNGSAIRALAVQSDGKILVGGNFSTTNYGVTRTNLMRLDPDGFVDITFFSPILAEVQCLAIQKDGKILVGTIGGVTRLNANGSGDSTFNPQ